MANTFTTSQQPDMFRSSPEIARKVMPTDRINHYSLDQVSKPMVLDISETKRLLGWEPKQSLEQCLEGLS